MNLRTWSWWSWWPWSSKLIINFIIWPVGKKWIEVTLPIFTFPHVWRASSRGTWSCVLENIIRGAQGMGGGGFLTDLRQWESWSFKSFSYMSEGVDKKTLTYSLYTGRWTREWRRLFCTADSTGTRTSNNMLVIQITNHDFNNASSTAWFWSIQHVHIVWGW